MSYTRKRSTLTEKKNLRNEITLRCENKLEVVSQPIAKNNAAHLRGVLNKVSYGDYPPGSSTTYPFTYLYLIVPFWYASAVYQASLVEPWFVFWRDAVEPKYPW